MKHSMPSKGRWMRIGVLAGVLTLLVGIVGACAGSDEDTTVQQSQQPAAPAQPAAAAAAADPEAAAAVTQPASSGTTAVSTAPTAPSPVAAAQYKAAAWEGMPQYGGEYRFALSNPKTLSSLSNVPSQTGQANYQVVDRLIGMLWEPEKYTIERVGPLLAESWDTSSDGLTWTFHLRKGVKWHDGDAFTSADVKASFDHFLNPPEGYSPTGRGYLQPFVDTVETPDKDTVVLNLKGPSPMLLFNLASIWPFVWPKKYLEGDLDWFHTDQIGTGPFKWIKDKWVRGVSYRMERNDDYYIEGLPYLDSKQVFIIADPAAKLAAFETQKVDHTTGATLSQVKVLQKKYGDELKVATYSTRGITFVMYNARQAPFDNPLMRQAVYHWLDRNEFLQKVTQGVGYLGDWVNYEVYAPFGTPYAELSKKNLAHQPDKTAARKRALELAQQAGFSQADLGKIELRVLVRGHSPTLVAGNQILAGQLRQMGFDAEVMPLEALAGVQALRSGDFEITLYGGVSGFPAPDGFTNRYLSSVGPRNYSGLDNPILDKFIANLNVTVDTQKRADHMAAMDEYLQTGHSGSHIMYTGATNTLMWDYLGGHRWSYAQQEIRDERTWLAAHAPGRK